MAVHECSREGCSNSVNPTEVDAGFFDEQVQGPGAAFKFRGALCPTCAREVAEFIKTNRFKRLN